MISTSALEVSILQAAGFMVGAVARRPYGSHAILRIRTYQAVEPVSISPAYVASAASVTMASDA
jgi:hypothetical protein